MSKQTHSRIRSILEKWEAFDLAHPHGNEHDFAQWLLQNENSYSTDNEFEKQERGSETAAMIKKTYKQVEDNFPIEVSLNIAMTKFWRVLRNRLKVGLTPLGLSNVDDFGYLASMFEMKNPTKTELIVAHLQEITTGTEIIKRLVNNGWLKENPHPSDKRSKVMEITEEGRNHIQKAFQVAMPISIEAYKALDKEQIQHLYRLIKTIEQENTEPYYTLKNEIGKN
jgi:DNA-binding MarR family transcriptional regulator